MYITHDSFSIIRDSQHSTRGYNDILNTVRNNLSSIGKF